MLLYNIFQVLVIFFQRVTLVFELLIALTGCHPEWVGWLTTPVITEPVNSVCAGVHITSSLS